MYRVYLCTVVERNLAEVIADLPASFTIVRGAHRKTQTLLSRGARDSAKTCNAGGNSGGTDEASGRLPLSNDDEIPLKRAPRSRSSKSIILRQTSIDVRAHAVDARAQEHGRRALVGPWDRTSANV